MLAPAFAARASSPGSFARAAYTGASCAVADTQSIGMRIVARLI